MENDEKIATLLTKAINRRKFFRNIGYTGLGVAGAGLMAGKLGMLDQVPGASPFAKPVEAASYSDIDILNFALNLEYLEGDFYSVVTTNTTLLVNGVIPDEGGKTTGGHRVDFTGYPRLKAIAEQLYEDEKAHVILLRTALGAHAVKKPAINLDALGIGFNSVPEFLTLARAFEDVGVSAYGGAAPLLTSKDYLAVAARIALTEALHAGNLRLEVAEKGIKVPPVDKMDIVPPPAGTKYFTVDANALAIVRTPSEVLSIVYASSKPGTMSGGFFPNGTNGTITTV